MVDQLKFSTEDSKTYENYYSLLFAETTAYDNIPIPKLLQSKKNNNDNRRVDEHEITDHDSYSWES